MSAAGNVELDRPPALPRPWTKARVIGYAVLALWLLAGTGMVLFLVGSWSPEFFAKYGPWYGEGLLRTVILVVVSIILGAVISLPVAYARMSKNRILSALAYGYV
ncbi:MAG: amino acid ABC transporter permease, partial [Pseudomonadota bacterium]|nr:amino acid ABC transporter permease [Pseudomonadota bacterium]